MEIKQINAGANCYLISQGKNGILIDTGMSGNEKKILKECGSKNMKLIILTHGHIDHIGCAKALSEKWNVPIAINERDLNIVRHPENAKIKGDGIIKKIFAFLSVLSSKYSKIDKFEPTVFFKEGDSLQEYGIDGQIVELPGHTAGSIGIKTKDSLFAGDALFHIVKSSVAVLYENKADMLKSVRKIQDMGQCTIYYGHGTPVQNKKWI